MARRASARVKRPGAKLRVQTPTWTKAPPLVMTPSATVDDAIAIIGTSCRTHWKANLAAAIEGSTPEGAHQVRVSLRRLRSALSLFKKYIPETQRTALNGEAKWLLTQLGAVRDLDVFSHTLAKPLAEKVSEDAGIALLIRGARDARTKAHAAAAAGLTSKRAGRFAARLDAWFSGRGWNSGGDVRDGRKERAEDFARKRVNRRLRKLLAEYGDVSDLSVNERHELRIAAKKVRYGLEFFGTLLPSKRTEALSSTLKQLQDCLGHLNDIDVAERTIATLTAQAADVTARRKIAAGGRHISRYHKKAAKAAEPKAEQIWRKVRKLHAL